LGAQAQKLRLGHRLIWILYNPGYEVQEAWLWEVQDYRQRFEGIQRLRQAHIRWEATYRFDNLR